LSGINQKYTGAASASASNKKTMIKITEKAKRVIPETLKNHPSKMLRIIVSGFG